MELSKKMNDALNKQANAEFYSAYLYLAMSATLAEMNYGGASHWMYLQYQEENSHALKLYKYVMERGGKVELDVVDKPKQDWKSVQEIFEDSLAHEQLVTEKIVALLDLAEEEKDYPTRSLLNWYIDEQVEEEANVKAIVEKLKMVGESTNGLFMIDSYLGKRGKEA